MTVLETLQELRSYADLKLRQYRHEGLPEHHAMVATAVRMVDAADQAIYSLTKGKRT